MNERLMHKRIRIAGVETTRKSIPLLSPQPSVDFEQLKQQLSTPPGTSQGQPFSVSSGGGGGGGRGVDMASATATIAAAVSEQQVAWRAQVNTRMAEMVTKLLLLLLLLLPTIPLRLFFILPSLCLGSVI